MSSSSTTGAAGSERGLGARLADARRAQEDWARAPIRQRLAIIRATRHAIARHALTLAAAVGEGASVTSMAERLTAEVLPLAESCRFLERRASKWLRPRRLRRGRPLWLMGSQLHLRREPFGCVLVIGASNYPLMLPGIQAVQALAAGNAVLLKPGRQGSGAARALAEILHGAGLSPDLFQVLDESESTARDAIREGVDKVIFTGSASAGKQVLQQLATSATPAVVEMSGCDAVFIPDATRLHLAVRALRFGLTWNASATCIAPRRVFVARSVYPFLLTQLKAELEPVPALSVAGPTLARVRELIDDAVAHGAEVVQGELIDESTMKPVVIAPASPRMRIMSADIFAPILTLTPYDSEEEALSLAHACPFALGASIFGPPRRALELAGRIRAGVVLVNDMIVPTADPRLPFGGRGESGYGVTRGEEGLLELTQLKAVAVRRGEWRPHFDPLQPDAADRFASFIAATHGGSWRERMAAFLRLMRSSSKRERI